jgi:excisionase family DNA binding protein
MEQQLVSIVEAARLLSVSKDTIRRLVDRGALRKVRVLRRILIPVSEVQRLSKPSAKMRESGDGDRSHTSQEPRCSPEN